MTRFDNEINISNLSEKDFWEWFIRYRAVYKTAHNKEKNKLRYL